MDAELLSRGAGTPFLLVHDLAGSWRSSTTLLPALSATRDVVARDLPGHGDMPEASDSGTFPEFVDGVGSFLEEQGLRVRGLRRWSNQTARPWKLDGENVDETMRTHVRSHGKAVLASDLQQQLAADPARGEGGEHGIGLSQRKHLFHRDLQRAVGQPL